MGSVAAIPGLDGGGGITASGGDITSEIGSLLSGGYDSATSDTPDIGDTPVDETPIGDEAPVVDDAPPVDDAPAPDADAPLDTQAPAPGDYPLSPDGKSYMIPKSDLASIKGVQQYHTAVSQLYPTAQDAHTSYVQASDHRAMSNDWMTGAEPNIQAVMNYWAGGDHPAGSPLQQKFQQSFAKMAEKMPDALAKMNPQAYESLTNTMMSKAIESAYEKAATSNNPEDLKRAQELDWGVTGQYKTELPKVDPQVKAQQDFERRQTEFNNTRTEMQNSQLKDYNDKQVEGAKFNEVNGLIDKTLSKVKGRYTDIAFNDVKNGIRSELISAMSGQPTAAYPNGIPGQREWFAEHKQAFDQLVNDFKQSWNPTAPGRGLEGRVQAYRQDYINRANRIITAIAKPRIETATRTPGAAARTSTGAPAVRAATQPQSRTAQPDPNKRLSSDEWNTEFAKALRIA